MEPYAIHWRCPGGDILWPHANYGNVLTALEEKRVQYDDAEDSLFSQNHRGEKSWPTVYFGDVVIPARKVWESLRSERSYAFTEAHLQTESERRLRERGQRLAERAM